VKWAIWIPWEREFRHEDIGSGVQIFTSETAARAFAGEGRGPCIHGKIAPACKKCWWQVVPWDSTTMWQHAATTRTARDFN